jgi:hypothetical protein
MNPITEGILLKLPATEVCRLYHESEIDYIPKYHFEIMLSGLLYSKSPKQTQEKYDALMFQTTEIYINNIPLMVERYLHIAAKRRCYAKRNYELLHDKRVTAKANRKLQPAITRQDRAMELLQRVIEPFHISTIFYEGKHLEVYCDVPMNFRHQSLTCFYTDPTTTIQYHFRNDYDLLPCEALTNHFLQQVDIHRTNIHSMD